MSEVKLGNTIFLYYSKCPKCGKLFAGLSKYQMIINLRAHCKRHGDENLFYQSIINMKIIEIEENEA
ncbi:MAG: hypothetical protein QXH85_05675 [Candidatus Bathyarchaeia archaeon]